MTQWQEDSAIPDTEEVPVGCYGIVIEELVGC